MPKTDIVMNIRLGAEVFTRHLKCGTKLLPTSFPTNFTN